MLFAYISLGSNLGDRAGNLRQAIERLREGGIDVQRLSQIYETEPVDTFPQPLFLNMVAELQVDSATTPEKLMSTLLHVEQQLGRTREVANGPRTIDLDLLFFGNETRATDALRLPHPRLHQRRFVLVPLAELAPALEHPLLHKTVNELLQQTTDKSGVSRWIL
jgi:2-amino-4-hydroxy-6-hydroxymethyldihydropteridine diphosphokinase